MSQRFHTIEKIGSNSIDPRSFDTKPGSADSFYLYDGLGSTRALTDATGTITDTYDYSAYGTEIDSTGSAENNYKFTGEQFDQNLNNYYLRARYYDPSVGRFTQMDSWMGSDSIPLSLNKFNYTEGDPVNNIDPSGRMTMPQLMATVGIGAGILAASSQYSSNIFSLDRTTRADFDGTLTDREIGISVLLMMGPNSALWKLAFSDDNEMGAVFRVEDELESEVQRLRERDPAVSISVPTPPRKRGWYTCIARAQDLSRSIGGFPRYGWGWGISKDFRIAKNNAVQMANTSIGAVDTHHAQWRCLDPQGNILRP